MPQPYSEDVRLRLVHAVAQQPRSAEEAAATFQLSPRLVEKRLRRGRTEQTVAPRPHGGGRVSPRASHHAQWRAWMAEPPDRTLDERVAWAAAHRAVTSSRPALSRGLRALGLPRKKSRRAAARSRPDVVEPREALVGEGAALAPADLVGVDDSGVTTCLLEVGRCGRWSAR